MTISNSFFTPVQDAIHAVENLMRAQAVGRYPDLGAALDLLLSSGGKRIRPTMTILVGNMLGAEHDRLVTLAAAIELLHTATLVHDDLIDGSLLRRGMPTLNSQWSPGATVLTGDFLFACAAKLAAATDSIPVMHLFSHTLTVIVNGEINQLFNSRCSTSTEDYFTRIYSKTASLFETSAQSAALISPVDERVVEAMRSFGYQVGMAFQIVDDILDFTGEQLVIGKPVGSDLRQGIITLPVLIYIQNNQNNPTCKQIINGRCPTADSELNALVEAIRSSSAIKEAMQVARGHVQTGIQYLQTLPPSEERQSLQNLAEFIVERDL